MLDQRNGCYLEPKHVLALLHDVLDVEEVHGAHVLAGAVAALAAAAQGEGRCQVEVVDVANGTVRAATHTSRRQCVSVWDLFTGSNQDPMLMGQ